MLLVYSPSTLTSTRTMYHLLRLFSISIVWRVDLISIILIGLKLFYIQPVILYIASYSIYSHIFYIQPAILNITSFSMYNQMYYIQPNITCSVDVVFYHCSIGTICCVGIVFYHCSIGTTCSVDVVFCHCSITTTMLCRCCILSLQHYNMSCRCCISSLQHYNNNDRNFITGVSLHTMVDFKTVRQLVGDRRWLLVAD